MFRSIYAIHRINGIKPYYVLFVILILSGFTHLWNAAGFPDIFFDEGVYMRRTMHELTGLGPQEGYFYDHPYFGQIFLASVLGLIGFPNSFHPSTSVESISMLYLVPRVIMGLLAVIDTFLIFKISENHYGQKVAIISSLLFAVMPITWITRRILLDSILLPFLLLSILLALKSRNPKNHKLMIVLSGICLGLAIFTKIPAFTMIPLVGGLIYFNTKRPSLIGIGSIPVILIPLLWPIQSAVTGNFKQWISGLEYQTHRVGDEGLAYISYTFLQMDPVLFVLGMAGISFCIAKKDYFILMWFIPFAIFLFAIGYNQYFYWIPVLPVFCIAAAILVVKLLDSVKQERVRRKLLISVVAIVGTFGFVSTMLLTSTNMTSAQFEADSYAIKHINDSETTTLASPSYSWILNYVFHKPHVLRDYSLVLYQPIQTKKVLLIADQHFLIDLDRGQPLPQIYNETKTVVTFDGNVGKYDTEVYPYTNLRFNYEGSHIAIKEK